MSQARRQQIEQALNDAYKLLGEYDRKILLEDDPRRRKAYEAARSETRVEIAQFEAELATLPNSGASSPTYNPAPQTLRVPEVSSKLTAQERVKFRTFLMTRFSLSELETLAFDLGIDPDSLGHNTKDTFARELIAYCERRDREIELIEAALGQRDDPEITQLLQHLKGGSTATLQPKSNTAQTTAVTETQASNTNNPPAQNTATANRPLQVFLCHSSNDKAQVRGLYQRLLADGFKPWLDEKDLIPGQNWDAEIRKAVHKSDIVVVCLSQDSTTKEGYVQREIKFALDRAEEKPEGNIYLIPLKLEECEMPFRLSSYHAVKYYDDRGYELLVKALRLRANQLGLL